MPSTVSRKNWFKVDADGFRQLQIGREPWKLVKELIANAWDEPITRCTLYLQDAGIGASKLTVQDDSPDGFADIQDARTFFRRTDKRKNPIVRGRFNLGEKEILSIARWATIVTTTGTLTFESNGEVRRGRTRKDCGSEVRMILPWGHEKREAVIAKIKTFLPPEGKDFVVNDERVPHREPKHVIECSLETVLEDEEGLRPTTRKTAVHVYDSGAEDGWVYEMGIPVVEIQDCPYLIDVQQKIPLSPNRDSLRPAFLKDLLAEVLNKVADELTEETVSSTWVRTATEDERATSETLTKVQKKRWGDKVALWSSDPHANERARSQGYTLVHGKTLSAEERERFEADVGIKHASTIFPTEYKSADKIPIEKWTKAMRVIALLYCRVGVRLLGGSLRVEWIHDFQIGASASYGSGCLTLNKARLSGWHKDTELRPVHLEILIHELAHEGPMDDLEHDPQFRRRLDRLAGKAVMLALEEPELFKWKE